MEKATFAGGCFWCMVTPFDQWEGIHQVISGYTGGHVENPSYEEVKTGSTGHYEAVEIQYDPTIIPYRKLLELYWPQIDPTDDGGQFHDRGDQYRTAIFFHTEKQKQEAIQSKINIENSKKFQKPIVTEILPAGRFYPAEANHQNYHKKNPREYNEDRKKSGRDEFIKEYWR
ncbi:peptide-methionine (S)-S-oxide reductase MsrA [Aquibacillus sp. 3ASR75-11]|uniref:Peptide methionine sulfoxide reductase MsrA n=1 Tax=Terrihalobacillus insolitus TaxID=2950438 RepID=A0A9X4ANV5_9BACI|nr:peptide-methionine (S)-S-oxide reductase MsrA [Terrihalobacillus insolitus]MDC3415191.1 peptide-methionine (S)-S-oxide reductase MsrA [Terrihalobacillus insolitus]MDC3426204.1 peptide-methionine (S)-S-oxide reductase MsrA [Terrihalobacillus insolitus]